MYSVVIALRDRVDQALHAFIGLIDKLLESRRLYDADRLDEYGRFRRSLIDRLLSLRSMRGKATTSVALANKMARIAWALLAKGGTYRAPQLTAA